MKRFIVIQTTQEKYENQYFEIETHIKNHVTVPFSTREWRCVMFDGIRVQLISETDEIIGSLM